ncbi:MAG: hypothetical protein ACREQ5_00720 [Candidatus Dormibacteria bacterium]
MLIEARKNKKPKQWTQTKAAQESGFSLTTWQKLETGWEHAGGGKRQPHNPTRDAVIAAAAAVGIDVNDALTAAGIDPNAAVPPVSVGRRFVSTAALSVRKRDITTHISEMITTWDDPSSSLLLSLIQVLDDKKNTEEELRQQLAKTQAELENLRAEVATLRHSPRR